MSERYLLLFIILTFVAVWPSSSQAQSGAQDWTSPTRVFEEGQLFGDATAVVPDPAGGLHVFSVVGDQQDKTTAWVVYSHWDGVSWSEPIDVFPYRQKFDRGHISAIADGRGILHVVLHYTLSFQYWQAPARAAGSAQAWKSPPVPPLNGQVQGCSLALEGKDKIHLACAGGGDNPNDVYYTQSIDGGDSWSRPINVSKGTRPNVVADDVVLAVGGDGVLHLVWSENPLPEAYPPSGVYYARSADDGRTWSEAIELGGKYAARPAVGLIGANIVHVVWGSSLADKGKYHRWSADGGITWTALNRVRQSETGKGDFDEQMVVDSAGVPHWLMILEEPVGSLLLRWDGQKWIEDGHVAPEFTPGIRTPISFVRMYLSEGNRLGLFFNFPERGGRLYHTWRILDAPQLPMQPWDEQELTVTHAPAATQTAVPTPTPTPRPIISYSNASPSGSVQMGPWTPIAIGLVPVLILVGGVVLVRALRSGRS